MRFDLSFTFILFGIFHFNIMLNKIFNFSIFCSFLRSIYNLFIIIVSIIFELNFVELIIPFILRVRYTNLLNSFDDSFISFFLINFCFYEKKCEYFKDRMLLLFSHLIRLIQIKYFNHLSLQ